MFDNHTVLWYANQQLNVPKTQNFRRGNSPCESESAQGLSSRLYFFLFERRSSVKQQKSGRIALRLSEEERRKVDQVATLTGCNLSEAVRRMVRATRLEPVATLSTNSDASGLSLATTTGISR